LYEELSYQREMLAQTPNEKISVLCDVDMIDDEMIEEFLSVTLRKVNAMDGASVRAVIRAVIPEFQG
jgi:hypothetical protein